MSGNTATAVRKKAISASERRARADRLHKALRFCMQIVFFIVAPGLFSGAFNGVKYIFTQIGLVEGVEATAFVTLLVGIVAFTVLFGRFFCGYACAFGAMGDVVYTAVGVVLSKLGIGRPKFPALLVKVLSLVKYAVLLGICIACVTGVWQQVSGWSPWVAFAGIVSLSVDDISGISFALLGACIVLQAVRERSFCQFLCPLGAVFSLLPVFGFSEFTRNRNHCAKNCGRCKDACPVDIWPDTDEIGHGECISCGRCADACPMCNVNFVAIERAVAKDGGLRGAKAKANRPLLKTKEKWRLLRGTQTGLVLAKAAVLLTVCWALGAARYLPAFPWG